ncbi:MAG: methionine--tRNA ligase [Endomicrobium sp.]|jgi:methionyl-tRNA synthetase|nr:methionine--tRNA ligase [Endomicrobium sp.]
MKFYVTTPIYYVNDVPHIGHSYTTIVSDVIARWKRLNNFDVFFLTGTDEHGSKIAETARRKNKYLIDMCNEMSNKFKEAWKLLNISYTEFVRTTESRHFSSVENVAKILLKNGFIFKKKYEGLYCLECERFYSKKDLDEKGNCIFHKISPIVQSEENYFFKLSFFQNELFNRIINKNHKEHIAIYPEERRNEIIGKLKLGLDDISFSRMAVKWGINLPFDKKHTVYVWIDALINYMTGVGYMENILKFQKFWPADIHVMAKDILWFHSVIWPAILIAIKLPTPRKIFSHGFFTINGHKMSKSLNNVISPFELVNKYGVDATRYIIATIMPFGPDGDISMHELSLKYNVDLANNFGNLILRIIKMAGRYYSDFRVSCNNGTLHLAKHVSTIFKKNFSDSMDNMQFNKSSIIIQSAIAFINKQIEIDVPWRLVKIDEKKFSCCINSYLQAICIVVMHMLPFMPTISEKIWRMIGGFGNINDVAKKYFTDTIIPENGFLIKNVKFNSIEILFPKIENK